MARGRRVANGLAVALGVAAAMAAGVHAQSSESKTKIKAEHGKTVTYVGCLQTGTETQRYVLQNVVPMSETKTTGTSGTVTTTTYALIPSEQVEIQQHVGHKVQVTGVLIPAGKGEAKIETKSSGKGTPEEHRKTEIERGPLPQLRVLSVKPLAGSCS